MANASRSAAKPPAEFISLALVLLLSTLSVRGNDVAGQVDQHVVLPGFDGKAYDLRYQIQHHGITVLNFWAAWCPPCMTELPDFNQVYTKFAGQNVAVFAIDEEKESGAAERFAKELQPTFPIILDAQGVARKAFDIGDTLPVTLIIDGKGVIRHRIVGSATAAALRGKIESLLQENKRP